METENPDNNNGQTAVAIMPQDVTLPQRERSTHKGDYGRVLIIGGSIGYTGAPVLSARAASKAGAGLTYAGVPKCVYPIIAAKLDEEMPFPLPDKGGHLAANAAGEIVRRNKHCDACLIGPGLGMSDDVTELVHGVIGLSESPLVLDADGLNAVAGNTDILSRASCPLVLTPHPGEFIRLGGALPEGYENVHSERVRTAVTFAKKHNCILVLKGNKTVLALPSGECFVNTTGGPAMAKGGSGDVLAGIIAAFIAQGFTPSDAAVSAVYLHGLAGDMCAQALGDYSVVASDIISMLPEAFKTCM